MSSDSERLEEAARTDSTIEVGVDLIKEMTNNFGEENLIGHGGISNVYSGVNVNRKFAIKVLQQDGAGSESERSMDREIEVLARFKHPNIVKMYGFCKSSTQLSLVFELGSDTLFYIKCCVISVRYILYVC